MTPRRKSGLVRAGPARDDPQIAQLAIDGNELACVGGDRENFGGPPEYFDGEISTSIEPGARASCRRRRRLEYNRRRGLNQNRTKRVLETREGILETLRRKIAKRSIKSISGRGGTGRRKGLKITPALRNPSRILSNAPRNHDRAR
jgi:hypothetical protein